MIPWNDAALHPYDHQQRHGSCYPSRQDPTTPRNNHLVTILNRFIGSVIDEPIPPAEFDYSDLTENSEKLHPPSVLPSKPSKLSTKRPSCLAICIYKDIATRRLLCPVTIKLSHALIFF